MQTEIEAKFLHVDHDAIRAKLRGLGGACAQPMRLMRRKTYDFPDMRLEKVGGWVRVRDEGDKITLSYKQLNDRGLHGTKEVTVTVSNFGDTCMLLEAIGLRIESYIETRRESWELDGVEIELDEWPWIQPFVEIEGPSEAAVKAVAAKLALGWDEALHGSVEVAYQAEYDVTEDEVIHCEEILFTPVPDWLAAKRREGKG